MDVFIYFTRCVLAFYEANNSQEIQPCCLHNSTLVDVNLFTESLHLMGKWKAYFNLFWFWSFIPTFSMSCLKSEINPGIPSHETNRGVQVAVDYKAPPNTKRSRREGRLAEKNSGKENLCTAIKGTDPYEVFARTDRSHGQEQLQRRPEWNTQRPTKAFIPASERYPAALQRHRQENRMRRQMELMTLVERNTLSRTPQEAMAQLSGNPSHLQHHSNSAHQKVSTFNISV